MSNEIYDNIRARIEWAEKELREAQAELRRLEKKPVWVPPKGTLVGVSNDNLNWSILQVYDVLKWPYWRLPEITPIKWEGGENPVPGKKVLYRLRSWNDFRGALSDDLAWNHRYGNGDIVEFLVINSDWRAK